MSFFVGFPKRLVENLHKLSLMSSISKPSLKKSWKYSKKETNWIFCCWFCFIPFCHGRPTQNWGNAYRTNLHEKKSFTDKVIKGLFSPKVEIFTWKVGKHQKADCPEARRIRFTFCFFPILFYSETSQSVSKSLDHWRQSRPIFISFGHVNRWERIRLKM